jgi:hypothetical protein
MDEGELATSSYNAYFAPNSTFTWKNDDATPQVTNTFVTSSQVLGSAPAVAGQTGISSTSHGTVKSTNPLGENKAAVPSLGKLSGIVSATGKLTLTFKGKSVKSLKAGKYKLTITDKSSKTGFVLKQNKHLLSITGAKFVGTHSATVKLSAGSWALSTSLGKKIYTIVVK